VASESPRAFPAPRRGSLGGLAGGGRRPRPWRPTDAGDPARRRGQGRARTRPPHPGAGTSEAGGAAGPSAARGGSHRARPGPRKSPRHPPRPGAARRRASRSSATTPACRSRRRWRCAGCPVDAQADAVRTALGPCGRLSLRRCARPARGAGETSAVPGHARVPGCSQPARAPAGHRDAQRTEPGPRCVGRLAWRRLQRPPAGRPLRPGREGAESRPNTTWPTAAPSRQSVG
jgi:hypothetical protein